MDRGETIRIWRPSRVAGVEVKEAETVHRRVATYHERYSVSLVRGTGARHGRYRGRLLLQPPGGIFLIEPGEVNATVPTSAPFDITVLFFDPHLLREVAPDLGPVHWRTLVSEREPELAPRERSTVGALPTPSWCAGLASTSAIAPRPGRRSRRWPRCAG